jgi:hypothetical protein
MTAQLNHTIVWCRDRIRSSALLVRILGCPPAVRTYNFMVVRLGNGVSLDFMETLTRRSREFVTRGCGSGLKIASLLVASQPNLQACQPWTASNF